MSKYEKKGTITFSPTAITDKEEVHELHGKAENNGSAAASNPFDLIIHAKKTSQWDYEAKLVHGDYANIRAKLEQGIPMLAVMATVNPFNGYPNCQENYLAKYIHTYDNEIHVDFCDGSIRAKIAPDNSIIDVNILD